MCKSFVTIMKDLLVYRKTILILVTPVALLPLIIVLDTSEPKCAYALLIMAVYWVTESLPLPVTALLPVVLFPLLGVMKGSEVASQYITDTSMVFLSGLMMALAIEKVQLHRRIGTGILLAIGATPTRILLGFMLPTWFLSMWISNTAATSMMIPVTEAVSKQLQDGMRKAKSRKHPKIELVLPVSEKSNNHHTNLAMESDYTHVTYFGLETVSNHVDKSEFPAEPETEVRIDVEPETDLDPETEKRLKDFSKMLCLAVAYSSNVGGTATLTGSPPNLLVADKITKIFESHGEKAPLTYATWFFFGFPHAVICFIILWLWIQFSHLGWRSFCRGNQYADQEASIRTILKVEHEKLGPIKFGEVATIIFLILMVFLWLARDPGFVPGYAAWFQTGYVTDAVPAIFICIILFMFPSERPNWICFRKPGEKPKRVSSLLDWGTVSTKLPWGPIILIGGGFALARGCEDSGLSELIGEQLKGLSSLPDWIVALITATLISFLTEVTSNTATIAVFLPILESVSDKLGMNPIYLMLTSGMAVSYAFMLPIATPPNAIVFAYGHLRIVDMMKVGFVMNVACILVVTLGINTWGMAIFNLDQIPWISETSQNFTTIAQTSVTCS